MLQKNAQEKLQSQTTDYSWHQEEKQTNYDRQNTTKK